ISGYYLLQQLKGGRKMFVISQDAHLLLQGWAKIHGLAVPPEVGLVSEELTSYLRKIFPSVEMVFADELQDGMNRLVNATGLIPVSLDRVYFQSKMHLDVTRAVDGHGDDAGVVARHGFKPLSEQVSDLKISLQGQHEVVLVDDVIFSGGLLLELINLLKAQGIGVPVVVAGVAIGEGIDVLKSCGIEVQAVRVFSTVIDEICERDFLPGVPLSGRTVAGIGKEGAPYILPFGRPQAWASIPEVWEQEFSKFCLNLAANVFDLIGQASGRQILPQDLERCPIGIDRNDQRSFADILRIMAVRL